MALYQDGILISGANKLPQLTLAEYNALPADQRPTYWERLDADYDDVLAEKSDIGNVESGSTASKAYSAGELLYYNGTLHKAKVPIASGATFTEGTNVEVANVSDVIGDKVNKAGDTMSGVLTIDAANGTTSAVGTSRLNIGNTTPSGTAGNSTGFLFLYGNGNRYARLSASGVTSNRNIELPDKAGTVALTSDFGWGNAVVVNLNSGTATYQKHALLGLKRVTINSSSQPSTSTILTGKIPSDYIPVISTLGTFYDNNGNPRNILFYDTGNSGKMMINAGSTTGLVGEYLYW